MYIHILEDLQEFRKSYERTVERELREHEYGMRLGISKGDPIEFLEELEESFNEPAVFIIDIDLKSTMSGFDVGVRIRELERTRQAKSHLIYVTGYSEQMSLTFEYKLAALDFISKGDPHVLQARIADCLRLIDNENRNPITDYLELKFGLREIKIPVENIIYISTSTTKNNLDIVLEKEYISFPATIKEMKEKLKKYDFFSPSESVLINREKIKKIALDKKKVILMTGMEFKISYRNARKMKQD